MFQPASSYDDPFGGTYRYFPAIIIELGPADATIPFGQIRQAHVQHQRNAALRPQS